MRNSVLVILLDLSRGRRHEVGLKKEFLSTTSACPCARCCVPVTKYEVGRRYDHFVSKAPMFFMQFANCMADCR